uniref:G-protein coupled receptors family 2 profile 2 domain-containing protein n=1 Tax=Timema douglasi TaxID=61478 RepID=A0A7R8VAX5_TIMDO|nr:unnamed protein product [Timema douglasi]
MGLNPGALHQVTYSIYHVTEHCSPCVAFSRFTAHEQNHAGYLEVFRLEPHYEDTDEFHVLRNGSLSVPYLYPDYYLTPHNYCLETFYVTELEGEIVLPLVCFEESSTMEEPFSLPLILYPIGLLISVPFLVTTMLVYCLIPQLRDLHGKTLSCHVLCLAAAYVLLAIVQLGGRDINDHLCTVIAFLTQFTFQACFFWLQVMCFDTLWVISSSYINKTSIQLKPYIENKAKEIVGIDNETFDDDVDNSSEMKNVFCLPTLMVGGKLPSKSIERRVFLCYSIYAWCWPIVLIIVSTMIDLIPTIPSSYIKPNFGHVKCWYSSQEAELNYFYGPIIFVLVTNMIMFVSSALMIWKSQWQEGSGRTERQTFRLSFSLFFVMGINWIMEVISWAAGGPKHIWYVTDTINTLQGVIIFAIFVLDKRVRELVQRQLWPQISQYLCKSEEHVLLPPLSNALHNRLSEAFDQLAARESIHAQPETKTEVPHGHASCSSGVMIL